MEYTQQQKDDFRAEYARRRKKQLLVAILIAPLVLVAIFTRGVGEAVWGIPSQVFAICFLLLIVAAVIFSFSNWRCPACNRYLGRGISYKFCPSCGVQLSQ
jgi:hypothetical protein